MIKKLYLIVSAVLGRFLVRQFEQSQRQMALLIEPLADRVAELENLNEELSKTQKHLAKTMLVVAAQAAGDKAAADILGQAQSVTLNIEGDGLAIFAISSPTLPIACSDPKAVLEFLERSEKFDQNVSLISNIAPKKKLKPWAFHTLKNTQNLAKTLVKTSAPLLSLKRAHLRELSIVEAIPELVPLVAAGTEPSPPPYHNTDLYRVKPPAQPKRRSVVFLNNNYYHYNCLSQALRKRGWDALTVSLQSPADPQRFLFHGEDVSLYDPDPQIMRDRSTEFFASVPERFGNLHFYGRGSASFFPELTQALTDSDPLPFDLLELRRHSLLIGTMPSGCNDGGAQSSIFAQADKVCDRCVWQLHPEVCNDKINLEWNNRLQHLCDWIGLEGDHQTPERVGPKFVTNPIVTCLDPDRWHPNLDVPEDMRKGFAPETIKIYHAVGNYEMRRAQGRDIKGSGAIFRAIDTLKAEGYPVELIFAHNTESTKVRYLQTQADIVVDQLNYGRYGANARESLMLGCPTIARLIPEQAKGRPPLEAILNVPIVDSTEDTITDVLRSLVRDKKRRETLGRKSREFALKWHAQDVCAERFEKLTDAIGEGIAPSEVDIWPASPTK